MTTVSTFTKPAIVQQMMGLKLKDIMYVVAISIVFGSK